MEADNACSMCMEVFTDPVSLPCGHGFCRGCLRALVGHNSRVKTGGDTSSDSALLTCPLCRAELTLGPRGVDELQPNQTLCELMSRCTVTDSAVTAPLCDMCEGEKKPAGSYCTNCMTLYCTECLSAMHPRRGPFGRHRLMTIEEYMSEKPTHKSVVKTSLSEDDADVMNCKEHREPLGLFCGTCERPICNTCVSRHEGHIMHSVSTTFLRNKAPFEDQTNNIRTMKTELEKLQGELISTQKDVQTKAGEELKEIRANYERCLKRLQDWRKSEEDKVDNKRNILTSETLSFLKTINLLIEETDRLLTSSNELLTGNEALFLLQSKELLVRFNCHSAETNGELKDKRQKVAELRSTLSHWDFRPCSVTLSESSDDSSDDDDVHSLIAVDRPSECASGGYYSGTPRESPQSSASPSGKIPARKVEVPKLKFTSSNKPGAIIFGKSGAEVKISLNGLDDALWVITDRRLMTGLQYWELGVTWSSFVLRGFHSVGSAGVTHELSKPSNRLGRDGKAWLVDIYYSPVMNSVGYQFRCNSDAFSNVISNVCTVCRLEIRLGFLLQTADRTLTVVDVNRDTRLFTFRDVDLSQPLVPVVKSGRPFSQTTFRLPPVNRLPKPVRDLLI